MNDRNATILGSLADVQTGPFGSQLHSADYVNEGTPIITVEHLTRDGQISHDRVPQVAASDESRLARYSLRVGDLVFSRVGAIDRCSHVSPGEAGWLFSGRLLRVRPDPLRVDSRFLRAFLAHGLSQRWIRDHAVGSTMPCLNTSILENVPVAIPSLPTQKRIAEILETADEAILSTERLIAKLEHAKQGLLHDLLTCGIDESGALRRIDQVHRVNGRKLPTGWRLCALSEIAEVSRGQFTHRPRNDPAYYGGEYPFIQTGDVTRASGGYISDAVQTLSKLGTSVSLKFPAGTIAVTIAANIADTGILSVPMHFPDSVVGVQVRAPHNIRFVELCIRSAKPGLEARAPQSAQKNINLKDLRPLIISLPVPLEQARIASVYEESDRLAAIARHELTKLRSVKQGLMEDLLTGRVSVGASE
jgi:type I restriction enzyme, S subunit